MIKPVSRYEINRIKRRFITLYGEPASERLIERFIQLIGRYGVGLQPEPLVTRWSEKDAILISYGDSILEDDVPPLQALKRFCDRYLKRRFSCVHILPFYPWSSDDGFSVIDYRQVHDALGDWNDVQSLGEHFDLMFDLVLNHCSARSAWFQDFIDGIQPARHYFLEIDPKTDLTAVVRPRTSPVLSPFKTRDGEAHVWTTFSADQVDLNWQNPDLLFEFLDILFLYLSKGVHFLRLDAVAFLWKEIGTRCVHLPQTHEIVKLLRDILEIVAPRAVIITETNVPQSENYSYFGDGDEAHMVYQFSLPPLLLHSLLFGDSTHLTQWALRIPKLPSGCTFFNFAASHDGIGLRPTEGMLSTDERKRLIELVESKGGKISWKSNPDGSQSPYEMNITYFSALSDDSADQGIARFLCSQSIVLVLKGIPGIYIHSLLGTRNDTELFEQTGQNRSIHRKKWNRDQLNQHLADAHDPQSKIFRRMLEMLKVRSRVTAFHPDAKQIVYDLGKSVFGLERQSSDGTDRVLCLHNLTDNVVNLSDIAAEDSQFSRGSVFVDLLTNQNFRSKSNKFSLKPYQVVWLKMPS